MIPAPSNRVSYEFVSSMQEKSPLQVRRINPVAAF
jgi:hypothetical protein